MPLPDLNIFWILGPTLRTISPSEQEPRAQRLRKKITTFNLVAKKWSAIFVSYQDIRAVSRGGEASCWTVGLWTAGAGRLGGNSGFYSKLSQEIKYHSLLRFPNARCAILYFGALKHEGARRDKKASPKFPHVGKSDTQHSKAFVWRLWGNSQEQKTITRGISRLRVPGKPPKHAYLLNLTCWFTNIRQLQEEQCMKESGHFLRFGMLTQCHMRRFKKKKECCMERSYKTLFKCPMFLKKKTTKCFYTIYNYKPFSIGQSSCNFTSKLLKYTMEKRQTSKVWMIGLSLLWIKIFSKVFFIKLHVIELSTKLCFIHSFIF